MTNNKKKGINVLDKSKDMEMLLADFDKEEI